MLGGIGARRTPNDADVRLGSDRSSRMIGLWSLNRPALAECASGAFATRSTAVSAGYAGSSLTSSLKAGRVARPGRPRGGCRGRSAVIPYAWRDHRCRLRRSDCLMVVTCFDAIRYPGESSTYSDGYGYWLVSRSRLHDNDSQRRTPCQSTFPAPAIGP
jgi:hypothetical protein